MQGNNELSALLGINETGCNHDMIKLLHRVNAHQSYSPYKVAKEGDRYSVLRIEPKDGEDEIKLVTFGTRDYVMGYLEGALDHIHN